MQVCVKGGGRGGFANYHWKDKITKTVCVLSNRFLWGGGGGVGQGARVVRKVLSRGVHPSFVLSVGLQLVFV